MTFLVLLIALVVERFFDWSHLREWGWFNFIERFVYQKLSKVSPYVILAATIIPVVIVVAILDLIFKDMLYGVPAFALHVLLLIYCFGPDNMWAGAFFAASNSASDEQKEKAKLNAAFEVEEGETGVVLHKRIVEYIFMASNHRVFAVVFWYMLLGIPGALAYRLVVVSGAAHDGDAVTEPGLNKASHLIQQVLDWLPIRVYTFLFALGGDFNRVIKVWRKHIMLGLVGNDLLLSECGDAALIDDPEKVPTDGTLERNAIGLLDRVYVILLFIMALVELII